MFCFASRNQSRPARKPLKRYAVCLALLLVFPATAAAQLRIVEYNTGNSGSGSAAPRAGMDTILKGIGDELRGGIAKPIDVLAIQESNGAATTAQAFVNLLNSIYGPNVYARGTLDGGSTGSGTQSIVYNTQSVQLIAETRFGTTNTSSLARQELLYQLRPVGYGSSADFYLYNGHWKAGSASTDETRRNVEAQAIRTNADALGPNQHIIYAGDFNLQSSNEAAYQTMLAAGNGKAVDPLNRPGNWNDNASFKDIHTQSPATVSAYGGQTLGGVDDRFDFQLVSTAMQAGQGGVSVVSGSYHTFGNTNTHAINGPINGGSAAALQSNLPGYTVAQAQTILNNLGTVTDHLPVVVDYQVPSKMGVVVASTAATVIRNAPLATNFTVANTASVVAVNGADQLAYNYTTSGALSGSGNGTKAALAAGDNRSTTFDTSSVGNQSGTLNVTSNSVAVANGNFSQQVDVTVLDHSIPSFSLGTQVTTLDVDFGTLLQGGIVSQSLLLANLASAFGAALTAKLDLDSFAINNPLAPFSTDLATFSNLNAGLHNNFNVLFNTANVGSFSAQYTLAVSDENLAGATGDSLLLTVHGIVQAVPEPASIVMASMAGLALVYAGVRRRRAK